MSETFLGNNADQAGQDAGSPAPAPAASPATPPPPSSTSGGGGGAPPDWAGALPEDARAYVENKGWKEPGDILKGYRQLEEFLGADKAGRGLVLPKDEKDQEALDKIYAALGRPEKAEGYDLTALMANEKTDPEFMASAATAMHEAGLSKSQAHKMAAAYQAHFNATLQAVVEAHQRDVAEAERSLSPEQKELCRRGFRFLGLDNDDAKAIEVHWGVKKAALLFAKIGQALGEDKPVHGKASGGFIGSPDSARNRIAELNADQAFRKRYLDGEPAAVKQMEELFIKAAEPAE